MPFLSKIFRALGPSKKCDASQGKFMLEWQLRPNGPFGLLLRYNCPHLKRSKLTEVFNEGFVFSHCVDWYEGLRYTQLKCFPVNFPIRQRSGIDLSVLINGELVMERHFEMNQEAWFTVDIHDELEPIISSRLMTSELA